MITKDDFISIIGFEGDTALLDKARRTQIKQKSLEDLLEEGAFRSATALAIYNNSEEQLQQVVDTYNRLAKSNYTKDSIARLFGVIKTDTKKTIAL